MAVHLYGPAGNLLMNTVFANKWTAILLAVVALLFLMACGGDSGPAAATEGPTATPTEVGNGGSCPRGI